MSDSIASFHPGIPYHDDMLISQLYTASKPPDIPEETNMLQSAILTSFEPSLPTTPKTAHIQISSIRPRNEKKESVPTAKFISSKIKKLKRDQAHGGLNAAQYIERHGRKKGLKMAFDRAKNADTTHVKGVPVAQRLENKER